MEEPKRVAPRLSLALLAGIALSALGIAAAIAFKPPRQNIILDFLGALLLTLVAVEAAVLLRQRGLRAATPRATAEHHFDDLIHLRCTRCQTAFERVDPGTRPLEAECPSCGLRVLLGVKAQARAAGAATSFVQMRKVECANCSEVSYLVDAPADPATPTLCTHCGAPLQAR